MSGDMECVECGDPVDPDDDGTVVIERDFFLSPRVERYPFCAEHAPDSTQVDEFYDRIRDGEFDPEGVEPHPVSVPTLSHEEYLEFRRRLEEFEVSEEMQEDIEKHLELLRSEDDDACDD